MNQTWKIIVAVVVTALVVGSGFYFYYQKQPTTNEATKTTTTKTFNGNGFSFTYPTKYTADAKGLWTEEGYKNHINPPEGCDLCQTPAVEVKTIMSDKSLDKQIMADFDLPGATLAEGSQKMKIRYEQEKIGDNDFVGVIKVPDMLSTTAYYTKHNNYIVSFIIYSDVPDITGLKDIMTTLKFE